jgi:hypothetical protein
MKPTRDVPELRPIVGFPRYAMAEDGTIWSRRRRGWRLLRTWFRDDRPGRAGRVIVSLYQGGKTRQRSPGRLWQETWGVDALVIGKHPSGRSIGSAHGRAKLDEKKVTEARWLHRNGWSYAALMSRYGIGRVTLHYALVGKTWSHVPMPPAS